MTSSPLQSAPTNPSSLSNSSPLPRWALLALLALFALLALIYSVVTPAFETPDEIWHYAFIQHLASGQGLPVSTPHTDALWRQQGTQSPGYYLVAAALTSWIDQSDFPAIYARQNPHAAIGRADRDGNINRLVHYSGSGVSGTGTTEGEGWPWHGSLLALHIARIFSILLGVVTLWASYRTVTMILGPLSALVGAAVLAFTPQFIFVSAAASNDNMVNALAALVIWLLVGLIFAPPSAATRPRRFAVLGLVLGIAALSKLSALGLIGLAGLTILGLAWHGRSWRVILDAILWVGVPVALIAGWWFARNVRLYHDPLAWNLWEANILLRVRPANTQTIIGELGSLFQSYWGLFGWLNLPYPDWVYFYFEAVSVIIVLGCALALVRSGRRLLRVDAAWLAVALLLLWLLVLIVSWLRFMIIAPAAQGRYFFPAAPTLIFIAGVGLATWRRWRIDGLVVISLALLALATPHWLMTPAYAAPAPVAALPANLTPVEVPFEGGISLVGIDAPQVGVHPGDVVTVTAAWRADSQPSRDLSVFVHLVDGDDLIAAQVDTMPGAGLSPTSQWRKGEIHVDSYHIHIPPTVYTPNQTQVAIGLYDALAPQQPRQPIANGKVDPGPGVIADKSFVLGQVAIAPPAGEVPNQIAMQFEDNIVLVGYHFNQRRLHPGDTLTVTLYWQANGPIGKYYKTFVHLLDTNYAMFGGSDGDPTPGTLNWKPGVTVEDTHSLTIPDNTPAGNYQIELGLYDLHRHRLRLLTNEAAEGATNLMLGPLEIKDKQ